MRTIEGQDGVAWFQLLERRDGVSGKPHGKRKPDMDVWTMWEVVRPVPEHELEEGDLIMQRPDDGAIATIVGKYRSYLEGDNST